MRNCPNCHVHVLAPRSHCPLCSSALEVPQEGSEAPDEVFPQILTLYRQFNLFFRLLLFFTVAAGAICIFINLLLPRGGAWSVLVLLGLGYMWLTIVFAARRRMRISKLILYQVFALSLILGTIDFLYGGLGWSVDYVIPGLCTFSLLGNAVIAMVSKLGLEEVTIYFVTNALMGIVPVIFVLTGLAGVAWPSLTCLLVSFLSVAGLITIGGRDILQEIRKRFHM